MDRAGRRPPGDDDGGRSCCWAVPDACESSTRRAEEDDLLTPGRMRRDAVRRRGKACREGVCGVFGMADSWALLLLVASAIFGAVQGQISPLKVQGQFRGGSISWEPVEPGSNTVRFTVTTAWLRSAGTYVKVVDGVARPERGYQPVKGDIVNVMGYETPKFVSLGTEEYLQVLVTASTEQVGNRSDIGKGLPHTNDLSSASNTFWANNWFEGVSEYLVTFPRRDVTYVAELQGCCRQSDMCRGDVACQLSLDGGNSQNYRDGVGIKQFFNTPFHLSATVRLDMDPPPVSFLPHFVPFVIVENGLPQNLELAVLDYMAVRQSATRRLVPQSTEPWPDMVIRQQAEATGTLAGTMSRPTTGRRLQNFDFQLGNLTNLDNYPPAYTPAPVAVDAKVTGTDVRRLNTPSMLVRLYRSGGCTGVDYVDVPPNMDVCEGSSAPQTYASGVRAQGSIASFRVPAGMMVNISDQCEFSRPPRSAQEGFNWGQILRSCDNRAGTAFMCCNITNSSNATRASMVRAVMKPPAVPLDLAPLENNWIQISHKTLADQRVQVNLRAIEIPVAQGGQQVVRSMSDGNYVIRLKIATATSCSATIEFILHLMTATSMVPQFAKMSQTFPITTDPIAMPTGFRSDLTWSLQPETFQLSDKTFFDNNSPQLFGSRPPGPPLDGVPPAPPAYKQTSAYQYKLSWSPCLESVGLYFYCVYGLVSISPFTWSSTRCTLVTVIQDLPPKIAIFDPEQPSVDQDTYRLYMGQSMSAVVRAVDHSKDMVDFLGVSGVDAVTGDRLRAKVEYVYDNKAGLPVTGVPGTGVVQMLGWPRLVEPLLPVFLKLVIGAPVANNSMGMLAKDNPYVVERAVTFRPNRMHSGLDVSVCFLAVDMRGMCKTVGSGTTRCLHVSVERCRYAMPAGHSLVDVAGMFETNWLQLFALNPLHSTPDVPVEDTMIINVGHLYTMSEGDTVHAVMTKFGMDVQHVMLMNADLSRNNEKEWTHSLMPGYELCVLPDSCGTDV